MKVKLALSEKEYRKIARELYKHEHKRQFHRKWSDLNQYQQAGKIRRVRNALKIARFVSRLQAS